jgi:Trk K+ transport system NAD-binding subunit
LIVSVQRGNQLIIPHGYTRLRAKDQLTIFAENGCLPDVEHYLDDSSPGECEIDEDQNE